MYRLCTPVCTPCCTPLFYRTKRVWLRDDYRRRVTGAVTVIVEIFLVIVPRIEVFPQQADAMTATVRDRTGENMPDVMEWLRDHAGFALPAEEVQVILHFTLLWSLFEKALGEDGRPRTTLQRLSGGKPKGTESGWVSGELAYLKARIFREVSGAGTVPSSTPRLLIAVCDEAEQEEREARELLRRLPMGIRSRSIRHLRRMRRGPVPWQRGRFFR